ncbi:hypothetical protein, partial [Shigella boydii]|uniref:hypothetical protein n=1 Tax=Shigella boydii TaxID=621 RepID=UPI001C0A68A7
GEYLPGSLQGKISSDGCSKKEQMVVSAIASTPHPLLVNSMRVSLLIYRHVIVMSVSVASLRSVAFVDGPVAVMMTY